MSAHQIGFLASRILSILVMIRIILTVPMVVGSLMLQGPGPAPADIRARVDFFLMPGSLVLSMAGLLLLCWLLWAKADWIGALLAGAPMEERVLVQTPRFEYLLSLGLLLLAVYMLVQVLPEMLANGYEYIATRRAEPFANHAPFFRGFLISFLQLALSVGLFYWSWRRISDILQTQPREDALG